MADELDVTRGVKEVLVLVQRKKKDKAGIHFQESSGNPM